MSRILRLAPLAPDMVEAILAGRAAQDLMLEQPERPLPASWQEQRRWLLGIEDRNAPPIRSRMIGSAILLKLPGSAWKEDERTAAAGR